MKKIVNLLLLVCLFSFFGNAQEQLPTEKKVAFGENEKMFVNKELGIYLWLSSSPDKKAPKYRLLSDSTKKYTNPMFFDTEGYNTLRSPSAVDPNTRRTVYPMHDIVFEVYSDGKAPTTKHTYFSGKSIYRAEKLYHGNGKVAFTLSAKDKISGIEKTYYSINGNNYSEYVDTVKLNSEGEATIKFYSTDKVGNRENPVVKNVVVDNSAPKTNYKIEGNNIKLESLDNLIGVKTIYYKINDGVKRVYTRPISIKQLSSEATISFYAIDYLNNTEEIQIVKGIQN